MLGLTPLLLRAKKFLGVFNNQVGSIENLYSAAGGAQNSSSQVLGSRLAEYTYSAYGEVLMKSGELADKNHVTYSTRYSEGNTGLIYYTYRHYAPRLHKWINKDPIAEEGGINLYQMVGNDTIGNWDNLGNIHVVGMAEKCSIDINVGHGSLHNGLPFSKDPKMGDANAANKICAQDAKRRKFTPCNYRVTAVSCYDAIANSKGNIGSYGLDNPNDVYRIRLVQYLKEALDETISEAESTAKKIDVWTIPSMLFEY